MSTLNDLVDKVARELQDGTVRRLQQYLLGDLSGKQRTMIEQKIVEDEGFFQDLLSAEDLLIQDYIRGLLPSDQAARLTEMVRTSAEWKRKVQFARTVQTYLSRSPVRARKSQALDVEEIYEELEILARRTLARERHQSIEPADLIHEAYMRLKDKPEILFREKVEFLATASRVMRRVLVDIAREQRSAKKGGHISQVGLSEASDMSMAEDRVLEIDLALDVLASLDARQGRTVELKFFSGLTDGEIADVLGVSLRTVKRDWMLARTWLHNYLGASRTVQ